LSLKDESGSGGILLHQIGLIVFYAQQWKIFELYWNYDIIELIVYMRLSFEIKPNQAKLSWNKEIIGLCVFWMGWISWLMLKLNWKYTNMLICEAWVN